MATYTVTSLTDVINSADDATVFTLREALAATVANGDGLDEIVFAASLDNGIITLTNGALQLTSGTVVIKGDIEGDGQLDVTVDGNFGAILTVGATANLQIDSLTLANGSVNTENGAGGLGVSASAITNAGTLSISNSLIDGISVVADRGGDGGPGFQGSAGGNAAIISSTGSLNILDTIIRNGNVTGGAGGRGSDTISINGYGGGEGGQAAAIISSGTLNMQNAEFRSMTVTGGAGGNGGAGFVSGLTTGSGGNGGNGGGAALVLNAGTARGELSKAFSSFNNGTPGSGGFGTVNGSPGGAGAEYAGLVNIGGGTSPGFDNHGMQTIVTMQTSSDTTSGSSFSDVIWGLNGGDFLAGGADNDDIAGGAGNDNLTGEAGDDIMEGGTGNDTMDGGTNTAAGDTLTFAGFIAAPGETAGITVNLGLVTAQDTGVGSDTITGFENVIGSDYNDVIIENGDKNTLRGGFGDDTLAVNGNFTADVAGEVFDGGTGTDTLEFRGFGSFFTHNLRNDTITSIEALNLTDVGGYQVRTVLLNADQFGGSGITLNATVGFDTFNDNSEVIDIAMGSQTTLSLTNLTFTGITDTAKFIVTGDSDAETITGSSISDTLNGNGGVDILNGGDGGDLLDGGTGADQMTGGADSDGYIVDNAFDVVNEAVGGGLGDIVTTSVDYTLAANQEIEQLYANNTLGTVAINLTGNNVGNAIFGNNGVNTINGGGGVDQMVGFNGNDLYIVDNALDTVNEGGGGGTADRVNTSVDYTLAANQQIELFSTTNSAGTGAINLTGNNIANTILGNNGANTINGGAGIDRMTGLGGNDNYFVDNAADTVFEAAGGGTADRVLTAVDYTLAVDQQIEILSTINVAAVNAINLTGNNLANNIAGNNGVNIINGGGGIDSMSGQLGSDLYYVDNGLDTVLEGVNAGTADRVLTSVDYTLGFNQQIELFSTANSTLTTAINLTGNNVANRILGNNGVNVINGGLANDVLTGGLGADKFFFNTAIAGGGNIDTIADFVHLTDDFQLAQAIFTGIGATLDATELRLGTSATTTTQRIVYDSVTGNVFFDSDGSAAGAQVQFAKVTAGTVLDINDFIMI